MNPAYLDVIKFSFTFNYHMKLWNVWEKRNITKIEGWIENWKLKKGKG